MSCEKVWLDQQRGISYRSPCSSSCFDRESLFSWTRLSEDAKLWAREAKPPCRCMGMRGGGQRCMRGCSSRLHGCMGMGAGVSTACRGAWRSRLHGGYILLAWIPLTLAKIWPQMLEIATILSALSMRSLSTSPRSIVRGPNEQKRQGVNQIPATEHQHC